MVPVLPIAAAALAVATGVRLARKEWRRVNIELQRARQQDRTRMPVLKRDKGSDEWRPS